MDTFNANQMPPMPTASQMQPKKSNGALISVIIILLLIIIGGMYFLGQRMNRSSTSTGGDQITESLKAQSDSDDLSSIEADLNASNYDSLDQGAAAFESEI